MNTASKNKAAQRIDRPTLILAALVAVLVVVEYFFAPHYRPVFPWHHVPGYMALIGLGACVLLVGVAKGLGALFLQRPETSDDRD
jgi:protein-S-isoprenylcysteine O-methyltransferase Ste14